MVTVLVEERGALENSADSKLALQTAHRANDHLNQPLTLFMFYIERNISIVLVADLQHSGKISRLVSQQPLQVADKAIHVTFSGRLADDVLVVVVPEAAA